MTDKKVAVVGAGYWGKNLVRVYSSLGCLGAICDNDKQNAKRLSEKYQVPVAAFAEVLNDDDIDGVVIATPAVTHYEVAKDALTAGKDVFVEKPLALHVEQARSLNKMAKSLDRILMVGHIIQYHPVFKKLKEILAKGDIGRVRYIYTNRLSLGKIRKEEDILWSFAPHDISMILALAGEDPNMVDSMGGYFLNDNIADNTVTHLSFPSGIKAHIYVSWLHPYKEQRIVVVADKGMIVFNDCNPWEEKLTLYQHQVEWKANTPIPDKAEGLAIDVPYEEPLESECRAFISSMETRKRPYTDGDEGIKVLKVLNQASRALVQRKVSESKTVVPNYFSHETACIDDNVLIGKGTKIWHFSHVLEKTKIGENCVLGQNVMVGPDVKIGNNCKIQNNVSLYKGVELDDGVFCGPSCVFTNVNNPRSEIERKDEFKKTIVRRGVTIGANATIVCGVTLGEYCFIGAGAVVTKDVPPNALMVGNPAKQVGWMNKLGEKVSSEEECYS